MAIKARWKGKQNAQGRAIEFHSGIPARNLTDQDWEGLSKDEQDTVLASKLYNVVGAEDSSDEDRATHTRRLERRVARDSDESAEEASKAPEGEDK